MENQGNTKIVRVFEQWTDEDVQLDLGFEQIDAEHSQLLLEWLKVENKKELPTNLLKLQTSLRKNVNDWNEDELKLMFIGPFLSEVDFNNYPHYKVFSQRKAEFITDKISAQGKIEWFVAQGKKKPRSPFFFLHEYKKELGGKNDPLGQLLIAMVYAQESNEHKFPIYGTYMVGRLWFFVVLEEKKYAVSRAYDATRTEDLVDIIEILHKVKHYIHKILGID